MAWERKNGDKNFVLEKFFAGTSAEMVLFGSFFFFFSFLQVEIVYTDVESLRVFACTRWSLIVLQRQR